MERGTGRGAPAHEHRRVWLRRLLLLATVMAIFAVNFGTARAVGTEDERATINYRAELSGANEVPPNPSESVGRTGMRWAVNADFLKYDLQFKNEIANVTQAHIHVGAVGTNGPVVAFLFGLSPPTTLDHASLASGFVRPENLVGPLAGNWAGFVAALQAGNLYVNVHTTAYPGGEVRGQIVPAPGHRDTPTTLPTTTVPPTTTTVPPTTTTTVPPTTTTTVPPTTTTTVPPTTTTVPPTTTTTVPPTTTTTTTVPPTTTTTTTTTVPPTTTTTTTVPPTTTTTTTVPPTTTTTTTVPPTTTTTVPPTTTTTTTVPPTTTTTTTVPPTTTTVPPTTTTIPPTQIEATMFDLGFAPNPLLVPVGRTVRWTNVGDLTHTSTSIEGDWNSGFIGSGGTYSFVMNTPGTFDYFCELHPGMEGTVVVSG